jgi:hypothetical protein
MSIKSLELEHTFDCHAQRCFTDPWSYTIRVRGTKYLWGSAGITSNLTFDKPLVLHIHNDVFGESITFGTEDATGTQTTIGTLDTGEAVSIPLQTIRGVFATCTLESTVHCVLRIL